MFGDVGHGLLLLLPRCWPGPAGRTCWSGCARPWPFVAAAGVASMVFGRAVRRVLRSHRAGRAGVWLAPLEDPVRLLVAGVGVGAVLLAGAYALGTVNRSARAAGRYALYAPSGLAGSTLFLGLGLLVAGLVRGRPAGWCSAPCVVAVAGPGAPFVGLLRRVRRWRLGRRAGRWSSCSTWWSGSAPTSCPSPGWPRSA